MKKAKPQKSDELRPEYKRSDFGTMVRGKYVKRIATTTNIVILEPEIAKAFPNDKIVNDTLRSLLRLATATSRLPRRKSRASA
jgi:hypothetical protein